MPRAPLSHRTVCQSGNVLIFTVQYSSHQPCGAIEELNSFLILIKLDYNFKELHVASGGYPEWCGYKVILLNSLFSTHLRSLGYLFLIYVHVCVCVHVGGGEWHVH